jgi:hypothetical protein
VFPRTFNDLFKKRMMSMTRFCFNPFSALFTCQENGQQGVAAE